MQQTNNRCVRSWVYRTCDPKRMFVVQPRIEEQPRTLKLDFNKKQVVNPRVQPRSNFVTVS